jgi:hypothetical protein
MLLFSVKPLRAPFRVFTKNLKDNRFLVDRQLQRYCDERGIVYDTHQVSTVTQVAELSGISKYYETRVWLEPFKDTLSFYLKQAYSGYMVSKILDIDSVISNTDNTGSVGWPHNRFGYTDKRDFMSHCANAYQQLQYCWDNLEQDFIWMSFPKLEILNKEKLIWLDNELITRSRQITGSNVLLTYNFNRYCLYANEMLIANHCRCPSAVGLSLFYGKWNKAFQKFKAFKQLHKGKVVCWDADFGRLDSRFQTVGFEVIRDFRKSTFIPPLSDQDERRFDHYYSETENSIIVSNGTMYLKPYGGQCSGGINTTTDNTLYVSSLIFLSWCLLGFKPSDYFTDVLLYVYGDDVFLMTSNLLFTFESASNILSLLGFKMTSHGHTTNGFENHPFLSHFIEDRNDTFVPVPTDDNLEKMWCSLMHPPDGLSIEVQLHRLISNLIRCAYHTQAYHQLEGYIGNFIDQHNTITDSKAWDTDVRIYRFGQKKVQEYFYSSVENAPPIVDSVISEFKFIF